MHSFTHFLRLKDIRSSPLSVGACSTRFTHHGRQRILNARSNELRAVYSFQDAIYRSSAYTNSKINVKIGRNRQIWPQALLPKTSKWCSQWCQIYCDGCLRIIDFHVSLVAATHLVLMSRKRFITRPKIPRFMWRSTVTAKSDHNPHLDDARSGAEFMFASESRRKRFLTKPNNSWIIGSAILLSWPEEICLELYIPVLKIDVCIGLELCNQSVKEDVMGWLVQRGDLSTAHHGPCINLHSHNHLDFQQRPCHCCWQNLCCICIDRSSYLSSLAHEIAPGSKRTTKAAIVAFNIFFRPLNTLVPAWVNEDDAIILINKFYLTFLYCL